MRIDSDDESYLGVQTVLREAFEGLANSFRHDAGLDEDAAVTEAAGCLEELLLSTRGPRFSDDGYLPPAQSCSEAEVARGFGFNAHRRNLLDRVRTWIRLARAVGARRLLLDGSFVTAKGEPGDVDAVVLLPDNFSERLQAAEPHAVELCGMFRTREPKELFFAEDEAAWWRWFEFFGRTRERNGRRKGLIEVKL